MGGTFFFFSSRQPCSERSAKTPQNLHEIVPVAVIDPGPSLFVRFVFPRGRIMIRAADGEGGLPARESAM